MKYFSPSYWFKLWLLSAPLFNDETIGINAKSIDNKKIKDWASNNTNLQSINQDMTFTNSSTNYQPYNLNQSTNQNIDPFYQTELETNSHKHRHEKSRNKRQARNNIFEITTHLEVSPDTSLRFFNNLVRIIRELHQNDILLRIRSLNNNNHFSTESYCINPNNIHQYFTIRININRMTLRLFYRSIDLYLEGFNGNDNIYRYFTDSHLLNPNIPGVTPTVLNYASNYGDRGIRPRNQYNWYTICQDILRVTEGREIQNSLAGVVLATSESMRFYNIRRNLMNIQIFNIQENRFQEQLGNDFTWNSISQIVNNWSDNTNFLINNINNHDFQLESLNSFAWRHSRPIVTIYNQNLFNILPQCVEQNRPRRELEDIKNNFCYTKEPQPCNFNTYYLNHNKELFSTNCNLSEIKKININNNKVTAIAVLDENSKGGNLKAGDIYVGTTNGLYKLSAGSDTPTKINEIDKEVNGIIKFKQDSKYENIKSGDIYISTTIGGYLIKNDQESVNKIDDNYFIHTNGTIEKLNIGGQICTEDEKEVIIDKLNLVNLSLSNAGFGWFLGGGPLGALIGGVLTYVSGTIINSFKSPNKCSENKKREIFDINHINKVTAIAVLDESNKGDDLKAGDIYVGTTNGVYLIHNNQVLGKFNIDSSTKDIVLAGKGDVYTRNDKNEYYHLDRKNWIWTTKKVKTNNISLEEFNHVHDSFYEYGKEQIKVIRKLKTASRNGNNKAGDFYVAVNRENGFFKIKSVESQDKYPYIVQTVGFSDIKDIILNDDSSAYVISDKNEIKYFDGYSFEKVKTNNISLEEFDNLIKVIKKTDYSWFGKIKIIKKLPRDSKDGKLKAGDIYVGTDKGIFAFYKEKNQINHYNELGNINIIDIQLINNFNNGDAYVLSDKNEIYYFEGWHPKKVNADNITQQKFKDIAEKIQKENNNDVITSIAVLNESNKGNLKAGDTYIGTTTYIYLIHNNELLGKFDIDSPTKSIILNNDGSAYVTNDKNEVYHLDRKNWIWIETKINNMESSNLNKELILFYDYDNHKNQVIENNWFDTDRNKNVNVWKTIMLKKINPLCYKKIDFIGNNFDETRTSWGSWSLKNGQKLLTDWNKSNFKDIVNNYKVLESNKDNIRKYSNLHVQKLPTTYYLNTQYVEGNQYFGLTWYEENYEFYLQFLYNQFYNHYTISGSGSGFIAVGKGVKLYDYQQDCENYSLNRLKRREIFDINNLEEKPNKTIISNELQNITKWTDEFTKSINHEQHLPQIKNLSNYVGNNITNL